MAEIIVSSGKTSTKVQVNYGDDMIVSSMGTVNSATV